MITTILSNTAAVVSLLAALCGLIVVVYRASLKLSEILRLLRVTHHHDLRLTRLERHAGLPPLLIREDPLT